MSWLASDQCMQSTCLTSRPMEAHESHLLSHKVVKASIFSSYDYKCNKKSPHLQLESGVHDFENIHRLIFLLVSSQHSWQPCYCRYTSMHCRNSTERARLAMCNILQQSLTLLGDLLRPIKNSTNRIGLLHIRAGHLQKMHLRSKQPEIQ